MNRILVTGNTGSGKTTLSKNLAQELSIDVYSLDSVVWKPNWVKASKEEIRQNTEKLTSYSKWVIDGVSSQVFKEAETVVFLDLPIHKCIFNVLKRFVQNGLKTRESLPENCPEWIGVYKALKLAFYYQRVTRPIILNLITEHPEKRIIHIKSWGELEGSTNILASRWLNDPLSS